MSQGESGQPEQIRVQDSFMLAAIETKLGETISENLRLTGYVNQLRAEMAMKDDLVRALQETIDELEVKLNGKIETHA